MCCKFQFPPTQRRNSPYRFQQVHIKCQVTFKFPRCESHHCYISYHVTIPLRHITPHCLSSDPSTTSNLVTYRARICNVFFCTMGLVCQGVFDSYSSSRCSQPVKCLVYPMKTLREQSNISHTSTNPSSSRPVIVGMTLYKTCHWLGEDEGYFIATLN